MTESYHYGVSGPLVWSSHILLGLFFSYVGYLCLNNKPISQLFSLILIVTGVLATLYHLHIWMIEKREDKDKK